MGFQQLRTTSDEGLDWVTIVVLVLWVLLVFWTSHKQRQKQQVWD